MNMTLGYHMQAGPLIQACIFHVALFLSAEQIMYASEYSPLSLQDKMVDYKEYVPAQSKQRKKDCW